MTTLPSYSPNPPTVELDCTACHGTGAIAYGYPTPATSAEQSAQPVVEATPLPAHARHSAVSSSASVVPPRPSTHSVAGRGDSSRASSSEQDQRPSSALRRRIARHEESDSDSDRPITRWNSSGDEQDDGDGDGEGEGEDDGEEQPEAQQSVDEAKDSDGQRPSSGVSSGQCAFCSQPLANKQRYLVHGACEARLRAMDHTDELPTGFVCRACYELICRQYTPPALQSTSGHTANSTASSSSSAGRPRKRHKPT